VRVGATHWRADDGLVTDLRRACRGCNVTSVGGALLVGRERELHFPEAGIQPGRRDGIGKTSMADSATLGALTDRPLRALAQVTRSGR